MGLFSGGGIGNFLSGMPIYGGLFDDSQDNAMREMKDARRTWDAVPLPSTEFEEYDPSLYASPESMQAQMMAEDPALLGKQRSNLNLLEQMANQGLTAEDELGFAKARDLGAQAARAGTQAALADANARGVSGGGLEFALREQANQGGAQRSQMAGLEQAAAAARQRALNAQAYQNALGGVRGQDAQTASQNTDVINKFNMANTTNRNTVNQANTDMRNQAQQYNQQGARDLKQQDFDNRVVKAGGAAQARTGMANAYAAQNAARTSDRNQNMQMFTQAAMMASDERVKKNVEAFDLERFLENLKAVSWDYVNPDIHGRGRHHGVMAQDLEKSPEGAAFVTNVGGVKMVDYGKMVPTLLAAVVSLKQEIDQLKRGA